MFRKKKILSWLKNSDEALRSWYAHLLLQLIILIYDTDTVNYSNNDERKNNEMSCVKRLNETLKRKRLRKSLKAKHHITSKRVSLAPLLLSSIVLTGVLGDLKRAELAEKFKDLKSQGKLDKYMQKKRKRDASKDQKMIPFKRRNVDGGDVSTGEPRF